MPVLERSSIIDCQKSLLPVSDASQVWRLAWPVISLGILQVVNQILDTFFLGHLETAALTAVGGAFPVTFLIFGLGMSFNTGALALVSRAYGSANKFEVFKASRQVLSISFLCGIIIAILGILCKNVIASFFTPEGNFLAYDYMVRYVAYCLTGLPAFLIIESLAGALIGTGDTKSPMVISGFQVFLHVVLNFFLILPGMQCFGIWFPGLDLGVDGGGLAYTISFWITALVYLAWTPRTALGSCLKFVKPIATWFTRVIRVAGPAMFTWAIRLVSFIGVFKVLVGLPQGSEAIAALRVGFAVESFSFIPAFGLSVAAASLIGQSLGQKDSKKAERLGWFAAHQAALVTAVMAILLFIFSNHVSSMLIQEKPAVSGIAATYIRFTCVTEFLFAYALVMMGGMQGAGDTLRPMWITILYFCLLRVPLVWLLAYPLGLGLNGCWLGMTVTQGLQGIASIVAFRKGAWKSVNL